MGKSNTIDRYSYFQIKDVIQELIDEYEIYPIDDSTMDTGIFYDFDEDDRLGFVSVTFHLGSYKYKEKFDRLLKEVPLVFNRLKSIGFKIKEKKVWWAKKEEDDQWLAYKEIIIYIMSSPINLPLQ